MNAHETLIAELTARLPRGERLLWHGRSLRRAFAVRVLHVRKVVLYFGALGALAIASAGVAGSELGWPALSALGLAGLGLSVAGFLMLLASLVERTTVYVITSRRIVMRIGIALPMTFNIPFSVIESVGLRCWPDGTGDIPLSLSSEQPVPYIALWPHVRPWRVARPQPMLRAVPDAAAVGELLVRAINEQACVRATAAATAEPPGPREPVFGADLVQARP